LIKMRTFKYYLFILYIYYFPILLFSVFILLNGTQHWRTIYSERFALRKYWVSHCRACSTVA